MSELDPLIHAPARLRLMALLAVVDAAEFSTVRDELEISDSVLSKHVSAMIDAGYVSNRKALLAGRRTTWLRLTGKGGRALTAHINALKALIDPVPEALSRGHDQPA